MAQAQTRKRSTGNIYMLLGMAAGAAIGAGFALVHSPAKGEENRKRLQEWAQARLGDAQDQVQARTTELQNKAQGAVSQGADWASARATEARNKAEALTGSITDAARSITKPGAGPVPVEDTAAEAADGTMRMVPEDYAAESGGPAC